VNVAEEGLKRFVKHMSEMVLELLCSLDSEERVHATGQAMHVLGVVAIVSVA